MAKPNPFFSLNAKYQIDPESTVSQLSDDLVVLLEVGVDSLQDYINEHLGSSETSSAIWAALYLFQQAYSIQLRLNSSPELRGAQA